MTVRKTSRPPIPITLLSGFLGSGKTTLLEHILKEDHGFRIAILINDLASVNIDAELISKHRVSQKDEKFIKLQNGCICCNLRGDLLQELAELSKTDDYDYLIIESSGVSEPLNVAQTFTEEFHQMFLDSTTDSEKDQEILNEIKELGGLQKLASIDTCVTVLDAYNFLDNFKTTDLAVDRFEIYDGQGEGERSITELMVEQIEFANVILVNKISMVDEFTKKEILKIIKSLNLDAKIMFSDYGKIDIREIVDTKLFSFESATEASGWIRGLNEIEKGIPNEHIDEYGIGSFVYRSRKPFHPGKLQRLLNDKFYLMRQESASIERDDEEEEEDSEDDSDCDDEDEEEEADYTQEELVNNKKKSVFGPVLRSKGFMWLASRMLLMGEWSSAGQMLTFGAGPPWFACLSKTDWPEDKTIIKAIEKDFQGEWGDRRQELVFIGQNINIPKLTKTLDDCLLTDEEMQVFTKIVKTNTKDGEIIFKVEQKLHEEFGDDLDCLIQY